MSTILQDLRFASRALRRSPGFAVVTALTLALGIGGNSAVFTVINEVILRPLPYSEPDRLVRVYQVHPEYAPGGSVVSGPALLDYRAGVPGLEHIAAFFDLNPSAYTLTGRGQPRRVLMLPVTSNYFEVYRIRPALGRGLLEEEEVAGARSIVISDALWTTLFDADPDVLSQSLLLDSESYRIVGVMPPDFQDVNVDPIDVWSPLDLQETTQRSRGDHYLSLVARLRDGVSLQTAQSQLDVVSAAQAAEYARPHAGWSARLVPLHDDLVGDAGTTLFILLGASTLVLLLACLNVANLFLARNVMRERELATRFALGSGQWRLAQQILTETVMIAGVGGLLGVFIAYQAVPALLAMVPEPVPRIEGISVDGTLVLFSLGITLLTGILAGLVPVARFIRPDLDRMLRSGARSGTGGVRLGRVRNTLIVSQVMLGIVLCVGAALLMRSFINLQHVELGVSQREVTTLKVHLPETRYDAERRIAFHQSLHDRLAALLGVTASGAVSWLPVSGEYNNWGFRLEGRDGWLGANFRIVEGDYFSALGVGLVRGRLFDRTDDLGSPPVAVVSEALAQRDFADSDPVGQSILAEGRRWEVVGVVGDVAYDHRGSVAPMIYLPHAQFGDDRNWTLTQVVSAARPWRDVVDLVRRELVDIDPELVAYDVRTMRGVVAEDIERETFVLVLMGLFGTIAILLVAVGIYGVLTYAVSQRTREIGIRLALGANVGTVRGAVVRHGVMLAGIGILVGLPAAFALTRMLRSLLFGVGTLDPWALTAVPVILMIVALLAAYLPARRATEVDPMESLRQE